MITIVRHASARIRTKSHNEISIQMERIYKLYGQGYGTNTMLQLCENKVYVVFTKMEY